MAEDSGDSGEGRKPRRRGAHVVRTVLRVAVEELARVGFSALSIEEVAARAGVNKTTVYRRWPTKEELVQAALFTTMDQVLQLPDTGTLRGDLMGLLRGIAALLGSAQGKSIMRMGFEDASTSAVHALVSPMLREQAAQLQQLIIQRAISRGELPSGTDAGLVMFTLVGAVVHRLFIEREPASDAWLERLVGLVLDGARGNTKAGGR